jgi:hypothetical protein
MLFKEQSAEDGNKLVYICGASGVRTHNSSAWSLLGRMWPVTSDRRGNQLSFIIASVIRHVIPYQQYNADMRS